MNIDKRLIQEWADRYEDEEAKRNGSVSYDIDCTSENVENGGESRNNEQLIFEMATRRPSKTGLPMIIWVDDGRYYIRGKHGKRIKFQLNKGGTDTNEFGVMDLEGDIIEPPLAKIRGLGKDIDQLRNFVHNNQYVLSHLADMELDIEDIWGDVIKGGEVASQEVIDKLNAKVDELIAGERPNDVNATKK